MHLLNQFNRLQAQSLNDICELIKSNKKWSSYVEKIWTESVLGSSKYPFAKEVAAGRWEVSSQPDFSKISHHIVLRDQDADGIPTCECSSFRSTKIPCPGISAVFNRIEDEMRLESNLHPRWRLSGHPLFQKALLRLNLCEVEPSTLSIIDARHDMPSGLQQNHLDIQSYQSILYPKKRDVRYTKLNQAFKRIEGKCIDNEHFYKLMMINLTKFGNSMMDTSSAGFQLPNAIKPPLEIAEHPSAQPPLQIAVLPPRIRGRTSSADDVNRLMPLRTNLFTHKTFLID